jgi:hypothetical protein
MANATSNPAPTKTESRFFEELAAKPDRVRTGLAVLNIALWAIPIIVLIVYRGWQASPQYAVVMLFLLGVLSAAVTLIYLAPNQRGAVPEADRLRIFVLSETALIGLIAALIGMGLPFTDRLKPIFSAGLDEWRKHPGALVLCGSLLFGGLVVMFGGLQLARRFERTRTEMRRLLYGYNSFLGILFLFAILALINLLSYARMQPFSWLGKARDWTSSKIYSLTPESETFLAQLKEPVTVYIMIPGGEFRDEITTLLDNCRAVTDKISWSFVSRDRDEKTLRDLQRKFFFKEALGVLVVVGSGADSVADFIKLDDLYESRGMSEDGGREEFKGEPALMKSIDYLTSGRAKAKVYFTQGHGELDVKARGGSRDEDGLGVLWDRLGQGNYEFHELDLSRETTVPTDAEVVVVAQPRQKLSPKAIAALEEYLDKRNGKLIVLSGVLIKGDAMIRTGLEPLLMKYNVRLNDDRVIQVTEPKPEEVIAVTNRTSDNPIARSGQVGRAQSVPFLFTDCRSVSSVADAPGSRYVVENLILALPDQGLLVERDLKVSPDRRADELQALLRNNYDKAIEMLTRTPVPLAVAVSEPRAASRANPHSFASDQQPKLLVFGEGNWIANSQINGRAGQYHLQLFSASLAWIRERPDVGIISVKSAQRTRYSVKQGEGDSSWKLFFQPLALMSLVILGMGGAVWIVRRR